MGSSNGARADWSREVTGGYRGGKSPASGEVTVAKHEEKADQDSQQADEKKGTENSGGDPDGPEGQHRK